LVLAIGALSYFGFKKSDSKKETSAPQVSGESTSEPYFDENATTMYFYSDYCSWCIKEKEVLAKLAPEGYRVKSMNVGKDQSLWETYSIKGTPTFVAKNGDRLEGFNAEDKLKPWLDQHK